MEKPNFFEVKKIEQYLNGELSDEELIAFENELTNNLELKDKVDQIKALPSDLSVLEKNRLSQQVKKWMDEEKTISPHPKIDKKSIPFISKRIMRYAAIFCFILIGAGIWSWNSSQSIGGVSQQYIAQYHQTPVVLRGASDENWEQAIESYKTHDFDQMITQMEPWIDDNNITSEQLFYYALANMYSKENNYSTTLDYFSKTEQKDNATYSEEIAWYKALIFIQKEEMENARIELIKIQASNRFGKGAGELLERLK